MGMEESRRRVVRRQWRCLIDQADVGGGGSFFGKQGKSVFSCSVGHLARSGGREPGVLVI